VDGRGDAVARATAVRILSATAGARYVSLVVDGTVAAVGRIARATATAALHCLAVRPDLRGRGLGAVLLATLARYAGADELCLQVMTANAVARGLYDRSGFTVTDRYHYRVATA